MESVVLLGTLVPFERVPMVLAHFTGVRLGVETVRRLTEAAGAVVVALDEAAVVRIEQALPDSPSGPAVQLLSVDGAMVPLVGGAWAEVKTLAVGTVVPGPCAADGTASVRTVELSYFSRLADAETFSRLATIETHRRGTLSAGTVCGVTDGAGWCQSFLDLQRHDAVRILDFAHAASYLAQAAQARYADEPLRARTWLTEQTRTLRQGDPADVLTALEGWLGDLDPDGEAAQVVRTAWAYLDARRAQITYADFTAAGYPLGSGCVESANKLVVEARLKGSGMHWARDNVNPLVDLRCMLCSHRWDASWPQIWHAWRAQARQRTAARRAARLVLVAPPPAVLVDAPPPPAALPPPAARPPRPKLVVNGKPTSGHPWNQGSPFRRAS